MVRTIYLLIRSLLFPPSEKEMRVHSLTYAHMLSFLRPLHTKGATALLPYRNQYVRALIHCAKYHNDHHAADLLGYVLAAYLKSMNTNYIVVPVPLSKQRERERGYNQVTLIVQHANIYIPSLVIHKNILERKRHTKRQTSLKRHERHTNMAGAFVVPRVTFRAHITILLIDDVLTTGATLEEAKKELIKNGYTDVTCIALAH